MKKMINATHVEGILYEHKLSLKVSGPDSKNPGTEFINGTIGIATDEDCLNVVQIHFSYVTETTAKGKANASFGILKNIIDGNIGTVMDAGKDKAGYLRIDSAIGLNEFYDKDDKLVSVKRNEGGFVHQMTPADLNENVAQRATFNTDIIITGCTRIEANEERQTPEKVIIRGAIFDFRGGLMPVEYSATAPGAMNYFESLEASPKNPVFTRVQGMQISQTVVRTITEESAFGEPTVKEVKNSYKDYVVNWAAQDTYAWDDEESILASEFSEAIAEREVTLAALKKRQDEYQATKGNALNKGNAIASAPNKAYNF